jgi:hypothetical protein
LVVEPIPGQDLVSDGTPTGAADEREENQTHMS